MEQAAPAIAQMEAGQENAPPLHLPPLPPTKDLPERPQISDLLMDTPLSHNIVFPTRSTSIPQSPRNFSRPSGQALDLELGRDPRSSPSSRYSDVRKSSGVHPVQHVDFQRLQMSAPSSDGGISPEEGTPDTGSMDSAFPPTQSIAHLPSVAAPGNIRQSTAAEFSLDGHNEGQDWALKGIAEDMGGIDLDMGSEPGPTIEEDEHIENLPQLQYFHQPYEPPRVPEIHAIDTEIGRPKSTLTTTSSSNSNSNSDGLWLSGHKAHLSAGGSPSPSSSPIIFAQGLGPHRRSPADRPTSYIDLLQTPYAQQVAPAPNRDNSFLRGVVGSNASLLDSMKTLEMYRANVKKTNDTVIQYEFAIFMVQTARELPDDPQGTTSRTELIREARQILQRLADRSYPFAQYFLADGYYSGFFNKGKGDAERAFPLFVAASKRGHAESGYRAGLCYEFGYGCRKDFAKAVKFYEMAASKNHPGSATRLGLACLNSAMGLHGKTREGLKWLKRAAESADSQYNEAPYHLGLLHEDGFGDDVFKDEIYAAQLFTQSANLGHAEANLKLGKAYECGLLRCPQDAALSIHFYNTAAQAGLPDAMMGLCAWYLQGADPVLEKDECEAYEWAKKAAELGLSTLSCLRGQNN
jgi:TPR repeat protein